MTDIYDPRPPWRQQFDSARDPYTARNTLGIIGTGGGGAPTNAEYITSTADATLTNERVLTNTATITWDFSTAGQAKASTAAGGGNVSNSGTPTSGQYGKWVTATTIQGVAPATVLSDIGAQPAGSYQPLDGDLTAIAALTGTNTIYYRSAANTWSAVNVSTGLAFSGGNLTSTVTSGAPVGAEYITSTADATLTSERVLTDTATVTWDRTTAGQIKANAAGGGSATPVPPQGRLTLQTATPVMTTTQSAKTTIYYTPYVGNLVPIYNGTSMVPTTFTELSVATTDTTKSPAAIGVSKVNDWFVWNDAGTVRVGHGPDWTSDTARSAGTALVMVNGILLNNAAITNGPAASRGTYVGTTRSNASSQLDFIFAAKAANGTAGVIGVWNAYNRVDISMFVGDTTDSWTYATAAWRAANGSATMRVSLVSGLAEDFFSAYYNGVASLASGGNGHVSIGIDTTTGFSGFAGGCSGVGIMSAIGGASGVVLGWHYASAVEYANAGSGLVFYGDLGVAFIQSGMTFNWRC